MNIDGLTAENHANEFNIGRASTMPSVQKIVRSPSQKDLSTSRDNNTATQMHVTEGQLAIVGEFNAKRHDTADTRQFYSKS